ncbi:type II restriction endonuclease, AlwI family [Campylobacter iguaniorum]|uniref:AlwI family type II restriction endonuclease n=1 Tax=Campylobacter iguaniorum TaxID=1244531 RepID=UPI00073A4C44|nr:AlwI family type II restriction endonuclease [Campylobacter iguaniorum]ALV23813.1 type II restriction endonuclease, AlwI family [Campylobacter iguaniorum]
MGKFQYKSYCWSLGTTSFRTENFNRTIEIQLDLLDKFWKLPQNANQNWSSNSTLQASYYDFLKENDFVVGDASRKDKDARQKTSGLVSIGLIDDNRKLTNAGRKVLEISKSADFSSDNSLQISKDSFLYLKQLLKTSVIIENENVRPLIVVLYLLNKHQFLNFDEFIYLLPLCTNSEYTEQISNQISFLRKNQTSIDEIIINRLLSMNNYDEALEWFLDLVEVSESEICEIGMNRKSPNYDLPYFRAYKALKVVFLHNQKDGNSLIELFNAIQKLNLKNLWVKYIFDGRVTKKRLKTELQEILNPTMFNNIADESEFKIVFFKVMHLLKAKATLSDYADLNRRYLGLSDIFLFRDAKVELDIIPKHFFNSVMDGLYKDAFVSNNKLQYDSELNEISPILMLNDATIINSINNEFNFNIATLDEAMTEYETQRYRRFNELIDNQFSDEKLIELLSKFENRDDGEVKEYITNNADIPTMFEYILGIIWYKISEREGKILDYMKLSLDADFFPKTHASGGEADIVYEYENSAFYPKHTLLLEATLADKTNQRRMELEPVSRHLGQHLLRTQNLNSYCVFATTHLDINVLSDFRSRKIMSFYDNSDDAKNIEGMKIVSLQTTELKTIIKNNKKYKDLYHNI